ncbi:MAG TPA: DinB family protein [Vicinamibacterales bacterium]|jgi:hypothetical protein|nr:DinB family protein [Vicinamibacterales bacterium]
MAPELEEFRAQFEVLSADAGALVTPLSDAQFTWSPSPDVWSVGQCIEHLNMTARAYLPSLDEGIASAIRGGVYGSGPFAYNVLGRLMVRSMEPPPFWRFKAPVIFAPPAPQAQRTRSEIMAGFRGYQVQYIDRLRQANGVDLGKAKVVSPANRLLHLSLGSGFALQIAHERRHLWQAKQLLERADFPLN